jgi:hypothetical protein
VRKIKLLKSWLLLTSVFYLLVFTAIVAFAAGGNIIKVDNSEVGVEFNNKIGQIDEFNLLEKEITIDDSPYALTEKTEYLSIEKRPIDSSRFMVGSKVIYNISDSREVMYLQLTEDDGKTDTKSSTAPLPSRDTEIFLDDGIYKN